MEKKKTKKEEGVRIVSNFSNFWDRFVKTFTRGQSVKTFVGTVMIQQHQKKIKNSNKLEHGTRAWHQMPDKQQVVYSSINSRLRKKATKTPVLTHISSTHMWHNSSPRHVLAQTHSPAPEKTKHQKQHTLTSKTGEEELSTKTKARQLNMSHRLPHAKNDSGVLRKKKKRFRF